MVAEAREEEEFEEMEDSNAAEEQIAANRESRKRVAEQAEEE